LVEVAFRSQLNAAYVNFFTGPDLPARVAYFMARCVIEDIQTRLLLMTVLVVIGGVLFRTADGRPETGVFLGAIVIAQASLIAWNTTAAPNDLTGCLYIACRFFAPGLIWGWLYWRHGYVTSTLAHATTHIPFQAGLAWML